MKKVIIVIVAVVVLLAGLLVFLYNSPKLSIGIGKPATDSKLYIEPVLVSGGGWFNLPVPEYIEERSKQIVTECDKEFRSIAEKYDEGHIETNVTFEGGKTTFEYTGEVVNPETGKTEKYSNSVVFDFVITKDII